MPPREGAGELAAEIAAVLTERGLGGNDADLAHRLDSSAATARAARERCAARWRSAGLSDRRRAADERLRELSAGASCRSPFPIASPRAAAAMARSSSPMAAARNVDPASPLAREPFLAVGGACRQRRAERASCWPRRSRWSDIEASFADRIETPRRRDVRRRVAEPAWRAAARRLGAIALAEQTAQGRAERGDRAPARRRHCRLGMTDCLDARRSPNGATA